MNKLLTFLNADSDTIVITSRKYPLIPRLPPGMNEIV